jgi:hypothetical protein
MSKPLQFGDPSEVGPFRLDSRLHESPAGIVYLGSDPHGRQVEVALLTAAAAGDAAARDRFRVAVASETPQGGPVPRTPPVPGPGTPAPVIAALIEGGAPWVATAYVEGHAGAERFLEPVLLRRGWGMGMRRRHGPQFQPYWLSGPRGPALEVEQEAAAPALAGDTRGLATAVIALAALLALLALLVLLLFSCEPSEPDPPKPTETPTSVQPTRESTPATPTPRPTPSRSGSATPRPSPTGGGDTVNPAARPERVPRTVPAGPGADEPVPGH